MSAWLGPQTLQNNDYLIADTASALSLFPSDYKGWSCLHHAATGGYTQTMETILGSHIKLLDKINDDGVMFFCGFNNVF